MIPRQVLTYRDFSGGLNEKKSLLALADNELSAAVNVQFSKVGALQKRLGYSEKNTSVIDGTPVCYGLHDYDITASSNKLIGRWGTTFQEFASGSWTDRSGATLTATLTSFDSLYNTLYFVNQTDGLRSWGGSGNSAAVTAIFGTIPKGKFIKFYKDYCFIANAAGTPQDWPYAFWWSSVGDPTTWTATDYHKTFDDTPITAMQVTSDYLFIFKKNRVYTLLAMQDGNFGFTQMEAKGNIGCIAHETCVNIGGMLFWLGEDGVYVWDSTEIKKISQNIETTFSNLNSSALSTSFAVYSQRYNQYRLFVPYTGSSTPNYVLVFDLNFGSWSVWNTIAATAGAGFNNSGTPEIVIGNAGYAYKMDDGNTDAGSAITYSVSGKYHDHGEPDRIKRWRKNRLYCEVGGTSALTASFDYDFGENADTQVLTCKANTSIINAALARKGRLLKPTYKYAGTDTFTLLAQGLQAQIKGDKERG